MSPRQRVCACVRTSWQRALLLCIAVVAMAAAGALVIVQMRVKESATQLAAAASALAANHTYTADVPVPPPPTMRACAAPLFYTACGDHADYHEMAVGMLRTTHAWLDPERRARARFVLYVGPRIAAARARGELPGTPAFIEYAQPDADAMRNCGLQLAERPVDWSYVRFPVLPALRAAYPDATCIVHADADEAVVSPLSRVWDALDAAGAAVRADVWYGKSEDRVGTDSPFRAGALWREYEPALADAVKDLPDLNSGNYILAANSTLVDPVVARFCGILRERRARGAPLPIDQPLVSLVLGALTPAAPYSAVNYSILDPLIEAPTATCPPLAVAPIVWSHFNWNYADTHSKFPAVMCAVRESLALAAAAPRGTLHVRIDVAGDATLASDAPDEQAGIVVEVLIGMLGLVGIAVGAIALATARWTCCRAERVPSQMYARQLDDYSGTADDPPRAGGGASTSDVVADSA